MAEQLNTFSPEQAPEEHEKEMLEKGEQIAQNNNPEGRPEWLPEKFNSAEEMARSYAELESKLGQPSEPKTEEEAIEEKIEQVDAQATEVAQVMQKVGLNFNEFQREYNDNGELSEKAYESLTKAGFPKSLVDTWIQGQEALSSSVTANMYSSVGGEAEYTKMIQWATDNLPENDITAFNASVDTQNPDLVRFAVQGLNARYRSEVGGGEPQLVKGNASTTSGGAYQSAAELTAAMRDPRYHNDPAYRKTVSDKLQRSSVF